MRQRRGAGRGSMPAIKQPWDLGSRDEVARRR